MYRMRRCAAIGAVVVLAVAAGVHAYTTYGKWDSNTVYFYVNPANQDVSESAATAAIQVGLEEWNTNAGTPFRFVYGGRVNDTTTGYDNRNVVLFRNAANPSGSGIIATTYWWTYSGGRIVDADIIFWDGSWTFFTGTSGCSSGAYIEDIAVHELGHALGLNHTSASGATMRSGYSKCSQAIRSIEADDVAGAQSLYGTSVTADANTAPVVSIAAPANNAIVADGTMLTFSGAATDTQDGNLTAALTWSSSLDGQIGTGGTFSRTLSAGTHTIRATVTDSGGLAGTSQVAVTVEALVPPPPPPSEPVPPSGPTLSVRAYKVKGAQKAELLWDGLTGSQTDVYRDGKKLGATPNDGVHTDAIDKKGGGTYLYQMCEAGTATCSNGASATF